MTKKKIPSFSDAMLEGAAMTKPLSGWFEADDVEFDKDGDVKKGSIRACAMGAAVYAVDKAEIDRRIKAKEMGEYDWQQKVAEYWPFARKSSAAITNVIAPQAKGRSLINSIMYANDNLGVLREKVAETLKKNGF